MIANYHTHTKRCNHAKGEDREYVESAIQGGVIILGFSDHCPWIYDTDYKSGTRMLPSQLDDYFHSLEQLRTEYANDITIYIGFEAEYIPEMIEKQYQLFEGYPVDYMIMGQHFTGIEYQSPYTGFETTDPNDLIKYVDTVIEGLETGRYQYVAHPDLLNYVGDKELYDKEYERLCIYLKSKNIPVEINLLGVAEHRHYPSDHFFQIAQRVGNHAIIGCDAHTPDRVSDQFYIKQCEAYAERFHLPLVHTLPGLDKLPGKKSFTIP